MSNQPLEPILQIQPEPVIESNADIIVNPVYGLNDMPNIDILNAYPFIKDAVNEFIEPKNLAHETFGHVLWLRGESPTIIANMIHIPYEGRTIIDCIHTILTNAANTERTVAFTTDVCRQLGEGDNVAGKETFDILVNSHNMANTVTLHQR